ncbi:hypothetical protein U9M48_024011 [Paspalum notatum var. saurae]|uniref:Uncharacterized protein n=1 Tax=Paspalum notatum var. saurae TaxID=547442 RepID=A0AAQ3TKU2_PASNO
MPPYPPSSASATPRSVRLLVPKQPTDLSEDPDEYDYFDYTGDLEQAALPKGGLRYWCAGFGDKLDDDLFFDGRR